MIGAQQGSRTTDRYAAAVQWLRAASRPRLGIDQRALGAFRIALGLILLGDLLFLRLPGLVPFYTDAGVFPRSALADAYPTFAVASIHAASGSAWVQGLLFAIAGCAAVCLLVGYRTRLSLALSLLLFASLCARNPHVVNGGDTILLTFLLFGLFLPLDARWAVDSRRSVGDDRWVFSLGTATLLSHFVAIYVTSAIHKYQSDAWMSGAAVPRIFHLEEYTVLIGPYLAEYRALLAAINWLWVALLTVSAFLILYTGRPRTALVTAFVCAHLGMAATMRLGAFPFVMIAGLLLCYPSDVWDRLERHATRVDSAASRMLPSAIGVKQPDRIGSIATGGSLPDRVRRGIRVGSTAVLACAFAATLLWHLAGVGLVDSPSDGLNDDLSDVSWSFFAPNPPDTSGWYRIEATLESGETIDAVDGGAVTFDRPPDAAETYRTTLWHRYGVDIRHASETRYEPLAAYVCETTDDDVTSVTVYHVEQPVEANGPDGDPVPNERISRAC